MRKTNLWILAAILTLCGLATTLTSCSDSKDEAQATPIGDELYKMWYAETTVDYTHDDGSQEQLRQIVAFDFDDDGEGKEYFFYVDANNKVKENMPKLVGADFAYTNLAGTILITRKDLLGTDAKKDLVREVKYLNGRLVFSNDNISLLPATEAQKKQLEAWLPDGGNANTDYKTIFLISDIHVMSPQLLEREGSAYSSYLNFGPKLLEYSADVLETLVDEAIKRKPDLVIIPGDLTKDGELVSHQLVASILTRLRTAGIPVILVPGNHDIDNPEGYYFNGDEKRSAERTSPEQFKQIYADFGYNQAYATDPASLSFVCEPLEGLVLLCLDTNMYENNLFKEKGADKDYNQTAGRIRPATLTWALAEADKARAQGKQVVLVEHHNIVQHHDAQGSIQSEYIIEDYQNISEKMMRHGVHLAFTGHTHLQDIAAYKYWDALKVKRDSLVDVATGSTISYPNPWRTIRVSGDYTRWEIATEYVKSIPQLADVQGTCYQRLYDNISGGLEWHIDYAWDDIKSYQQKGYLALLGCKKDFLPPNAHELTKLISEYLGDDLCKVFMIHNEGNEWQHPEAATLVEKLRTELQQLLHDRSQTVGQHDITTSFLESLAGTVFDTQIAPGLKSMLSDTNQMNDLLYNSRTDDINVVLTIGR